MSISTSWQGNIENNAYNTCLASKSRTSFLVHFTLNSKSSHKHIYWKTKFPTFHTIKQQIIDWENRTWKYKPGQMCPPFLFLLCLDCQEWRIPDRSTAYIQHLKRVFDRITAYIQHLKKEYCCYRYSNIQVTFIIMWHFLDMLCSSYWASVPCKQHWDFFLLSKI